MAPRPLEPDVRRRDPNDMVGLGGVEPPTSPLSGVRSNQLSYRPGGKRRLSPGGVQRWTTPTNTLNRYLVKGLAPTCRWCCLFKGGDPAARSRTATLLRLHP